MAPECSAMAHNQGQKPKGKLQEVPVGAKSKTENTNLSGGKHSEVSVSKFTFQNIYLHLKWTNDD